MVLGGVLGVMVGVAVLIVVTGVMEFIQEECSSIEVGKIIIERDKKMALAKDKDKKLKIYEVYKEKIEAARKKNN